MIEVLINGEWTEQTPVDGDEIRYTIGSGEYEHYIQTTYRTVTEEETAKNWRNGELQRTDWIVPVIDHPEHSTYLTYRQALRDWPSTSDFPDTKPTL